MREESRRISLPFMTDRLLLRPYLCEDAEGNLYIIYDRERDNRRRLDKTTWKSEAAKEILVSKVKREDVQSGILSAGSFLSRVISRGGVHTVVDPDETEK